jgi:beta-lactamase superfamily II metal-dependent hydrolase
MGYEVDFLAVGDGSKSGDAIALRFGNLSGPRSEQAVVVIDGGTKEAGANLVEHIQTYFGTSEVDLVVSTHPDGDHSSGLTEVLENLDVKKLWMHRPWEHAEDICDLFHDGRITDDSLEASLRRDLQNAHDLEVIAKENDIPIEEAFTHQQFSAAGGCLTVLGPTEDYYQGLLPHFRDTPEAKVLSAGGGGLKVMEALKYAAKAVVNWVKESWGIETLEDPDEDATSAENNSSVILFLEIDGKYLLFTGDAGVPALERAVEFAEDNNVDLTTCCFTQIPHHGSKRNIGPTILARIVGEPVAQGTKPKMTAFVSASKEGAPKHPAKKVTNAFQRRGAKVIATQGSTKRHHFDAPPRDGWSAAAPVPFYPQVEE